MDLDDRYPERPSAQTSSVIRRRRTRPASTTSRPTDTGSEKRRGPALPGLNQRTPLLLLGERLVRVAEDDHALAVRGRGTRERIGADERRSCSSSTGTPPRSSSRARAAGAPSRRRRCPAPRTPGQPRSSSSTSAAADVARVQDDVRARERRDRLRPDQAVRVGDDADRQLLRHSGWPMRTSAPGSPRRASAGSASSSTTVEPRLKAPISSPRDTATGSPGSKRSAARAAVRHQLGEGQAHPARRSPPRPAPRPTGRAPPLVGRGTPARCG